MAQNLLDRIASETELTKSERKLASVILKNPAIVINENIAQLAKRANVSEPSVFRFCKRFGADGFPAFKLVLSSIVSTQNYTKVESVKPGDSVDDVISKIVGSTKSSLLSIEHELDSVMVARIIDVISQSRRLIVLSQGLSLFAATDFKQRMFNMGFNVEVYSVACEMRLAISTLRTGDVALFISSSGDETDLILSSKIAKELGVCAITICPKDSLLSKESELTLACDKVDSDDVISSRLAILLIVQIIIGGVTLRRGIAIQDLKEKLNYARHYDEKKEEEIKVVDNNDNVTDSTKPITTLDWQPY